MSRAWLTALIRARQGQEDAAKQQLADAQRLARSAHDRARNEKQRIEELCELTPDRTTTLAFVAAAASLQAAASSYSTAVFAAAQADLSTAERRTSLTAAAISLSAVEKLQERYAEDERRLAAHQQQLVLDEVGARVVRPVGEGWATP